MKTLLNIVLLTAILLAIGCSASSHPDFDRAERLLEQNPDSALALLQNIDTSTLRTPADKATHALLLSMALDKNYIDTTRFDVLQPAIDYFLNHGGTPTQRLRTLYYQGRIYQNAGEEDRAIRSFLQAIDAAQNSTDTLTLARTLVAYAIILKEINEYSESVDNLIRAANLYYSINKYELQADCNLKALDVCILNEDSIHCDSLIKACSDYPLCNIISDNDILLRKLKFIYRFHDLTHLENAISLIETSDSIDTELASALVYAYYQTHEYQKAIDLLSTLDSACIDLNKYYMLNILIEEKLGNFEIALNTYKKLHRNEFNQQCQKYEIRNAFALEQLNQELFLQKQAHKKNLITTLSLSVSFIMLCLCIILILGYKNAKANKELAINRAEKSELESEYLQNRLQQLKEERDNLESLLSNNNKHLSLEVQSVLKERMEMINAFLASMIAEDERYIKSYQEWANTLLADSKLFMDSTRLALTATHPNFISYLKSHDLTNEEINYLCLHAIGLRGKDISTFLKWSGHFNLSSSIRRKLGLDIHTTNIGIYIRRLLDQF